MLVRSVPPRASGRHPEGAAHQRGGGERAPLSGRAGGRLHQEASRLPPADGRLEGLPLPGLVSGSHSPDPVCVRQLVSEPALFPPQVQSGDELLDQSDQPGVSSSLLSSLPGRRGLTAEVLQADPAGLAVRPHSGTTSS